MGFEMLITIVVSALLTFGNGFVIAIHNTTKPFFPRSTGPFIYYLFFSHSHFKPYLAALDKYLKSN
jgi:hypothetical protein